MACTVTNMNVTLPPLHTLVPTSSLPSPSPSPTTYEVTQFPPLVPSKTKRQNEEPYSVPRLPFPVSNRSHILHSRRISIDSVDSESSVPSLVYSPSPSPPPTRPASPSPFLLVPCELNVADAVVVVSSLTSLATSSAKSPLPSQKMSPIFRSCKPSEAKATLLIGPAISTHARKCATTGERRMHPYRIVRERKA